MLFAVAWLVRDEHVTRDGKLCGCSREGTRSERGAESQEVRQSSLDTHLRRRARVEFLVVYYTSGKVQSHRVAIRGHVEE